MQNKSRKFLMMYRRTRRRKISVCSCHLTLLSTLLWFLSCFVQRIHAGAAASSNDHENKDEGFARLVRWMRQHGGQVDPRIDVGIRDGIRGIVATADMDVGTQLLFCPWELIIGSRDIDHQMQGEVDMCQVVQDMADAMRRGTDSLWHPYLDHIELPRLPAMWDQAAIDELQSMPPSQDVTRHIRWFEQSCDGNLDEAGMKALVAFISRANEVGMTPIYDLLNHHNGRRNAKLQIVEDGVRLVVVCAGPVHKNDQLYLSYGIKTASTMFRDYGFVEDWPTAWNFRSKTSGDNFAFVLFPDGAAAINPTGDLLKSLWQSDMSLLEYQALAETHMRSLALADLERFVVCARDRLDEFPTTLQEDEVKLEENQIALSLLSDQSRSENDVTNRSSMEDAGSAIRYRSDFKRALNSAMMCADAMGQSLRERISRQDL
mmetsp:Transcript_16206/g.46569  ORF Transcript_16206/g.46569 Transcript_16206/m.46569 type:complete len:432 (-) Transcript_16206:102-1397(-)